MTFLSGNRNTNNSSSINSSSIHSTFIQDFIKELIIIINKNEGIKKEFKNAMKPFIELLLQDIYPYIYLSLAFVLITFFLILAIFIFIILNHKKRLKYLVFE